MYFHPTSRPLGYNSSKKFEVINVERLAIIV